MQKLIGSWRSRLRATERARIVSDALATFLVGLLLLAVGLVGTWGGLAPVTDRWPFVLTLAAICLVMLGKGRRPLIALAAGLVVFGVDVALGGSMGVTVALLDLIYSAALRASATAVRRMGVGVAVAVVGGAGASFVLTGDLRQSVTVALFVFALLGTPLWWGRSVRQQAELASLASARAQDLARIGELREQEVVHAERTRMAGDVHDALASHLSAIAIHAEAALAAPAAAGGVGKASGSPVEPAAADGPASVSPERAALSAIRASSVSALREMRAMIDVLRTGDEARTSPATLAELDALAAGLRGQGMEVVLSRPRDVEPLPAAVDQAAYRILQESLTNALKHGDGGPVAVALAREAGRLGIEVDNAVARGGRPDPVDASDAPDAPTHDSTGVGLLTMRERAEALGGTFRAGLQDGRWRVRAVLPVDEPAVPDEMPLVPENTSPAQAEESP